MADSRGVLAFVLAGGEGSRLRPLTADHAKPAISLVGDIRIVDFVLANLVNSGISTVYLLAQYKPASLIEHVNAAWAPLFVGAGRTLDIVLPNASGDGGGFTGTADAVHKNMHLIESHRPDVVAIFSADHVYRMDIRQMMDYHQSRNADVTISAIPVPIEHARNFGVMATGVDGSIEDFQEKPARPKPIPGVPRRVYASMGNYLFRPSALAGLLERMVRDRGRDFGHDVMPRLAASGYRSFAYDFSDNRVPGICLHEEPAYWRDVGTLDALAAAREDTQGLRPRFELRNTSWPIHHRAAGRSRRLAPPGLAAEGIAQRLLPTIPPGRISDLHAS